VRLRGLLGLALVLFARPGLGDDLKTLAADYWSWREIHQPISGDDVPRIQRPHGWAPDWSPATVASLRKDLAVFKERYRTLSSQGRSAAEEVDYRLLGSALERVHWELDIVRSWRRDPRFYVAQTAGALVDVLLPSSPFTQERGRDVITRLASFPKNLEAGKANLDEAARPFARLAIADLEDISPRLRKAMGALAPLLPEADRPALLRETEAGGAALEAYRAWLLSREGSFREGVAIGRESYLFFLRKVALIPLSPEEILGMGRQEWARAVSGEVLEAQRNQGVPPLPVFKDQQAQIDRAREDEEAIRRFLTDHKVLTVPPWMPHYGYRPLPPYIAPLAAFGEGTDFTSPARLGEGATRYIPEPSASLGYFALSMAQDPRADMVHEGIPGHAFQLALGWKQDDPIRRHWYDSGVNEGLGFYCEELMFQMGLFDNSPKTREMIWSYMRLRALRVEVDVRLALGTFSVEEAAKYLEKAVPMDAQTARSEAADFASTPGFAIGYEIGKLQIVRLLAEARRKEGNAFDLRAFHDGLWARGNVPIALQRFELLGLRDELDTLDGGTQK
jgi:hypothetical protein